MGYKFDEWVQANAMEKIDADVFDVVEASDLENNQCPKCQNKLKVINVRYSPGEEPELLYTDTECTNKMCKNKYRIFND